jgi:hypothetical protein
LSERVASLVTCRSIPGKGTEAAVMYCRDDGEGEFIDYLLKWARVHVDILSYFVFCHPKKDKIHIETE